MRWFGRNLRACCIVSYRAGRACCVFERTSLLGVGSVWMKIVRLACADGDCLCTGWLKGCTVGLCLLCDAVIDEAMMGASENNRAVASLRHRVALDAPAVGRAKAFWRQQTAGLLAIMGIFSPRVFDCSGCSRESHDVGGVCNAKPTSLCANKALATAEVLGSTNA